MTTTFASDATGQRTQTVSYNSSTSRTVTRYPFPHYEVEHQQQWRYSCNNDPCDYMWVTTQTTPRTTYFLAGRPIATRIIGDPVSGNNGLFYFLTDHLGSTTMLITIAGAVVAGTAAYYQPYGNYRTTPPTTLTERGYTGHHENRDIGLTYMNARYYVPGLGRFLTADTIVPSPANPQSHNRYTYVLGNPLVLVDPSGHASCYVHGQNEHCTDDTPMTPPPPRPQRPVARPIRDIPQCDGCFLPTLPTSPPRGLNEWGLAAWNGLQAIQQMTGGWWGDELDVLEAIMILLNHEVGDVLFWMDFPQEVIDVFINQYNQYCSDGPWSVTCLNQFWGYHQAIREATTKVSPSGGERFTKSAYRSFVPRIRILASGIINGTISSVNPSLFHYGNGFYNVADILYIDASSGNPRYSSYTYDSGPNSIFVIQTVAQNCRTGTLQWWNGIEKPGCGN